MSRATKTEEKILAQLDLYLARCERPPPGIHIYQKQADSVVRSRRRHKEPGHSAEYLEFSQYKGIPITVISEGQSSD